MTRDVLNYGKLEAILGKEFDPVRAFVEHVPYLVEIARHQGKQDAFSYRDFHVAGAMYAINLADKTIWQDTAGNLKQRIDTDKVCAEKKLLRRAAKAGMTSAIGLVVLGTTERRLIKDVSDMGTPTLHMCHICRDEMRTNPLIARSTLVVTSGMEDDTNQTLTVGQLLDGYDGVSETARQQLFEFQPGFTDWEQRVATYDIAMRGFAEAAPDITMRQMLAQLALSKSLKI